MDAVVFDVFGTLTDWRTSIAAEFAETAGRARLDADWTAVTEAWRRAYRPALLKVLDGTLPCRTLDELHRLMLDEVLAAFGLTAFIEGDRAGLVQAWSRLQAWPDVPSGLAALQATPLITATLSNGSVGLLTRLAKRAGLRFDCVLSTEQAATYKPDPRAYLMAAELLGVRAGRLLMVACHPDDLEAAAGAGLRTAYIPRPEWGPDAPAVAPPAGVDVVVPDVPALARLLS
ncbi:haloacid dehalogenase type II [Streptomyces alanosinicus]|uniref:Haloacid dehalogenase n=1 Tax=Streptomyces alanosinicus TaxID=68171 RepID=A0A918YSM1_9ACTN|nr:haloacid dehalogenase type II [Streptomyces alanosinicus]GHE14389.1 haloacid dehalogenase [Streptomyces alanosinicus]